MKKSLYIYLSSLLGILLFLILHRIVVFAYLLMASMGYEPFVSQIPSLTFSALEYLTLVFALLLGAWYGIWLGMYWFEKVYEQSSHPGLVGHLVDRYWPRTKTKYNLESKIEVAKKRLEADVWKLEDLAKEIPVAASQPEPIKKRIVRKRAPRKLTRMT